MTAARRETAVRAYLELVRVFLTPTAVADSFAAYCLACATRGSAMAAGDIAAVAAASGCVYWLGMAANDLFDRRKDATAAPGRPIPSGRVTPAGAVTLCAVLGAIAILLGAWRGTAGIVAGLIALAIAYDAGGKRVPVAGNVLMGLCRAGNFLLGAATALGTAGALADRSTLLGAGVLGAFIALVTSVSRLEDAAPDRRRLLRAALPVFCVPAVLATLGFARPLAWVNAAMLLFLLGDAVRGATRLPAGAPIHPAAVFVRQALPGIFLVDAGSLLALSPPDGAPLVPALVLYALFCVAWVWKRRWMRRGSQGS